MIAIPHTVNALNPGRQKFGQVLHLCQTGFYPKQQRCLLMERV